MSKYKVGDKVKLTGAEWNDIKVPDRIVEVTRIDLGGHARWGSWDLEEDEDWGTELYVPAEDNLNPSHYTSYKDIEVIQLTEQLNFNRGNAVKYIARAGLKNPETEIEDLKKAAWYLSREIERLEKNA